MHCGPASPTLLAMSHHLVAFLVFNLENNILVGGMILSVMTVMSFHFHPSPTSTRLRISALDSSEFRQRIGNERRTVESLKADRGLETSVDCGCRPRSTCGSPRGGCWCTTPAVYRDRTHYLTFHRPSSVASYRGSAMSADTTRCRQPRDREQRKTA